MIGGIMGAYKGYEAFDEETLKTIEEVNEYSLVKLSEEIKKIVEND
jgi:ADP-ribosylglycohydrolase